MEIQWFYLHYYFSDDLHSMDAFVRNKCEREILAIFEEVGKSFHISFSIESVAYEEGGLKEYLKLIAKYQDGITTIASTSAVIISLLAYISPPNTDKELERLTKESIKLENEKKKLEIKKLQIEVNDEKGASLEISDEIVNSMNDNIKIAIRRSNFYKNLSNYKRISSVGFATTDDLSNQVEEKIVSRTEFQNYVLSTTDLPIETDENALIEIFSPILIEKNYHWKGYYLGEVISFSMNDKDFKDSVFLRQVRFQHGTRIRCILDIHRKYDEIGEAKVTGYVVKTVLELSENENEYIETVQGRKYKQNKKLSDAQSDLFNEK